MNCVGYKYAFLSDPYSLEADAYLNLMALHIKCASNFRTDWFEKPEIIFI